MQIYPRNNKISLNNNLVMPNEICHNINKMSFGTFSTVNSSFDAEVAGAPIEIICKLIMNTTSININLHITLWNKKAKLFNKAKRMRQIEFIDGEPESFRMVLILYIVSKIY